MPGRTPRSVYVDGPEHRRRRAHPFPVRAGAERRVVVDEARIQIGLDGLEVAFGEERVDEGAHGLLVLFDGVHGLKSSPRYRTPEP